MSQVSARLAQRVRRRAQGCCEYCQSQERVVGEAFTLDHIIPRAKARSDAFENLALCCYVCNPLKGAKTEALDPQTGDVVPLFHPQLWYNNLRYSSVWSSGYHEGRDGQLGFSTLFSLACRASF